MPGWNFADVWEAVAAERPDDEALVQGGRRFTWSELDRRADGLAAALLEVAGDRQAKVAEYLYNSPEYLEVVYASAKAGLVPVNTNYRYLDDELVYLWDNADAVAVVFHGTFTATIERVRVRVPRVRLWLWVDDGSGPCPDWAVAYEQAVSSVPARPGEPVRGPWGRSGDDCFFIYTGGTTGMPKGVMWHQDDLYRLLSPGVVDDPDVADLDAVRQRLRTMPGQRGLPACPLMHGTGFLTGLSVLMTGGCVVTLTGRRLDVAELLDTIEAERIYRLTIVGDAFARPMLDALDAEPGRWDLSSLRVVVSSGAMWSEPVKKGLSAHIPDTLLVDMLGASEAVGVGQSVSSGRRSSSTARFKLGPRTKVFTDDGRAVAPGSGEIGQLAVGGPIPVGYYKDPDKTARTFRTIDGERWSIPGDWATVEADGVITLLGRGSVCINTGGEKVFPEEVEEALKTHPAVRDAVVVGIPNERFGEEICAVVEAPAELAEADLVAHVKERLASYKAPRHVLLVTSVERAPNGKADYPRWKREAAERVGPAPGPPGSTGSPGAAGSPDSARAGA